ncbi:MAG: PTS sugar transporter subunit IIC, partial [Neisseriaceae bacterium]|nr:PTS sugar transporter subunit IIC [Neisseriaceae bacterium]
MSFSQYLKNAPKRFFITAFSGMAQGLFVTLIAGTILAQIAGWIGTGNAFGALLSHIAAFAKTLMGAGIGVGIAYALNKGKLLTFSAMVAGLAGAFAQQLTSGNELTQLTLGLPGNPIGAYIVTMFVVELVALYE